MPPQSKTWQAYQQFGALITFPIHREFIPIPPDAVTVINRTVATIQVGAIAGGTSNTVGPYTIISLPWNLGNSLYVTLAPGSASPGVGDFLEIDFLAGEAARGASGQIIPLPPTGWGAQGPTNSLVNVAPGSTFQYGQIQQLINILTGIMTGQPISLKNYMELLNLAGAPVGQVGPALRAWMQTSNGVIQAYDATLATLLPLFIEASSYQMTNGPIFTEGVDAAGLVRSTGIAFIPSAGSGVELFFTSGIGFLSAYNRSGGGGPLPMELQATRFIAPTVGASGKQFLNRVVLPGPAPSTTFTPPGSFNPTLHTLTGLPASAVACTIEINMPGVGTDRLSVAPDPTSGAAGAALIDTAAGVTGQQVHCAVTSPSQLAFTWLSVATHPISVFLIDYDEPS